MDGVASGGADGAVIAAWVARAALDERGNASNPVYLELEGCVVEAVAALRNSRVTAFVPLLALRRVRCCIRAGTCDRGPC